jgi:hypothetical protein
MKRYAVIVGFVVAVACGGVGMSSSRAQDAGKPGDGSLPVELAAGGIYDVCSSGQVVCPARNPICDDPKVVTPVDLPNGLGFKGVSPGTTLCSVGSAAGPRRVFRFTVQ